MKKYPVFLLILVSTVFLTGCSSAPDEPETEAVPAAIKSSSVLKSTDGGKSWEFKGRTVEKASLDAADAISMAINPYDAKNVLVGTLKGGIWKTDDAGENWSLMAFQADKVYGLAIDPTDSRIIYASGVWQDRGKIFKSIDGGNEWNEIYTAPSDGPLVISLALDRKNPSVLYATTSDNQMIKSADAGFSWRTIYVSDTPVLKISIDSADSDLLYLNLLSGRVLRSRDGGETIAELENGTVTQDIGVIETDPSNAGWVYAAGRAGIFRSKDAGENWETVRPLGDANAFPVKAIAINPANPGEVVYGAAQATYKSVDGGVNWTPFQLQTGKNVSILEYSTEPGVIYLGLRKK